VRVEVPVLRDWSGPIAVQEAAIELAGLGRLPPLRLREPPPQSGSADCDHRRIGVGLLPPTPISLWGSDGSTR